MDDRVIEDAIRYMWKHCDDDKLSMEDIAKHLAHGKTYFCRAFKNKTGISPGQFLAKIRLYKACELLQESQLTFYEICNQVGVRSVGTFGSKFRKVIGVTPNEFRNTIISLDLIKSKDIFEVNLPCL